MSEFDHSQNDLAVAVVTQLFRLLRSAQMHSVQSLLAQGTLKSAAESFQSLARDAGGFVVTMFADETVFVNGQPVRAQRSIYENILTVGQYLGAVDCNEVTIRSTLRAEDLGKLLDYVVNKNRQQLPSSITLQYVDPAKLLGEADGEQPILQQVAAVYGAATVLVRRCDAQIREDNPRLMRHVKRVAQRLVTLTRTGFPELLALARRPAAPTDHAAISVNAAVIGALCGRALTDDIHSLLRITMAALQAEIGKPRVAGMYRTDGFQTSFVPQLNQHMRRRLPGSTAVMLLQAGRAAEQPLMRAVAAYETAHLEDGDLLGWPYEGKIAPTVESIIASVARRVARTMVEASNPDEFVATLQAVELGKVERAALDITFNVLGVLPVGTPVELTSGWRGVVVSSGRDFASLERAHVVLLLDEHRRAVEPQVVSSGGHRGWVRQVITRDDQLLSSQYEQYVSGRTSDDYDLPSTTGVLTPDFGDHLADRASLDFESEAASQVVDSAIASPWLPTAEDKGTITGRPEPVNRPPPDDLPPGPIASKFPTANSSAPKKVPSQFQQRPESGSSVPPQFQQKPSSAPKVPAQFQQKPSSGGIPAQFKKSSDDQMELDHQTAAEAANATYGVPKQFQDKPAEAPTAEPNKVPGAWIRPAKGAQAEPASDKPVDPEPKNDDDSSEDGDFDALKDIVLFD